MLRPCQMHQQEQAPFITNRLQKLQYSCCNANLRLASSWMCSPFLPSLSGCRRPSLSVAFPFLSLPPFSFSLVFLLNGRMILPFVTKKAGQKLRAPFCGNKLYFHSALDLIWFLPPKVASSLRDCLHPSLSAHCY